MDSLPGRLRGWALAAALPVLALSGCGGMEGARSQALIQACGGLSDDLMQEDWSQGINGWQVFSTGGADHSWTLQAGGQMRSDPGGVTPVGAVNRLDSPVFEPMGRPHMRVKVQTAFDVAAHGVYQVFISSRAGGPRSLIAEFGGRNPSWPNMDEFTLAVPESYSQEQAVYLTLVINSAGGGDYGAAVGKISVVADEGGGNAVLLDDFTLGLSRWSVYSDPGRAGHVWEVAPGGPCGQLALSDPAGTTVGRNYTRLESDPFSLEGKTTAEVVVRSAFNLPPGSRYQVFVADMDTDAHRSLIAEWGGTSPGYPAASQQTVAIPADFLGRPRVRVAFLALTGDEPGGTGVALESVQVLAR